MERVEVSGVLGSTVPKDELRDNVRPAGIPPFVRETGPVNPLRLSTVMVAEPDPPAGMANSNGLLMSKSAAVVQGPGKENAAAGLTIPATATKETRVNNAKATFGKRSR